MTLVDILLAELKKQYEASGAFGIGWLDSDDLRRVKIDGEVDLIALANAVEAAGHRLVKDVAYGEASRPGFDQRSYDVGYMEGENSSGSDWRVMLADSLGIEASGPQDASEKLVRHFKIHPMRR